jgi:hypothetical protein
MVPDCRRPRVGQTATIYFGEQPEPTARAALSSSRSSVARQTARRSVARQTPESQGGPRWKNDDAGGCPPPGLVLTIRSTPSPAAVFVTCPRWAQQPSRLLDGPQVMQKVLFADPYCGPLRMYPLYVVNVGPSH